MSFVWLVAILTVLATYRVSRLVATDTMPLIALPREALVGYWYPDYADADWTLRYRSTHDGVPPRPHWGTFGRSLAYLATCEWCVSMYVAPGIVVAEWYWSPWLQPLGWTAAALLALTASAVTGLIAQREPE